MRYHNTIHITEELLYRPLKLSLRGKVRYAAPVMLLQSLRGPDRNPERTGDYLRGLDRLGLFAAPDHGRTEATESGRQHLGPTPSHLAESPSGCRLIALYIGLRMTYQC